MTAATSFSARQWRGLVDQALAHAEAPGRPPGDLLAARRRVKGLPFPSLEDRGLFQGLVSLAEAYCEGEIGRRLALAVALAAVARECDGALEGPGPAPPAQAQATGTAGVAAGDPGGPPPWWNKDL